MFVVALAATVGALSATTVSSCTTTVPAPPAGIDAPPTLRIVNPYDGACIPIGDATTAIIPVTIDVAGSFYLRPPGNACNNTYNCGFVQLYVNNRLAATSGTAIVTAEVAPAQPGETFTLTVVLVWDFDDGGPATTDFFDANVSFDGYVPDVDVPPQSDASVADPPPTGYYQQTVTVTTARTCGDAGTGGAGGGTTLASSSSAATSAGAGGAPSSTSSASSGGAGGAGGSGPADAGPG